MSGTLFDYYRANLNYLRALGGEFAAEYPKVAARLDLGSFECSDPFVERLLEGCAFLAARVEKRLDEGFPRMLEAVLGAVAPHVLEPVASSAVLALSSDPGSRSGARAAAIPAGSLFESDPVAVPGVPGARAAACRFRTLWETTLTPFEVSRVMYHARGLPHASGQTALEISFTAPAAGAFAASGADSVDLFWTLTNDEMSALARQLLEDVTEVLVRQGDGPWQAVEGIAAGLPALADRGKPGLLLMADWFLRPHIFRFVRIEGLSNVFRAARSNTLSLAFLLKRRDNLFISGMDPQAARLSCVPVENLFMRRTSRVLDLSGEYFELTAERTAPYDYEIHRLQKVDVFDSGNRLLLSADPYPTSRFDQGAEQNRAYFHVHRTKRLFPGAGIGGNQRTAERLRRTNYAPDDVKVALSGPGWLAVRESAAQISADALCSNPDLPAFLKSGTHLTPPVRSWFTHQACLRLRSLQAVRGTTGSGFRF